MKNIEQNISKDELKKIEQQHNIKFSGVNNNLAKYFCLRTFIFIIGVSAIHTASVVGSKLIIDNHNNQLQHHYSIQNQIVESNNIYFDPVSKNIICNDFKYLLSNLYALFDFNNKIIHICTRNLDSNSLSVTYNNVEDDSVMLSLPMSEDVNLNNTLEKNSVEVLPLSSTNISYNKDNYKLQLNINDEKYSNFEIDNIIDHKKSNTR